jgi:hypothetical protein
LGKIRFLFTKAVMASVIFTLVNPSGGHAETLGQFLSSAHRDVDRLNILATAARAYLMANAELISEGRGEIYCIPKTVDIEVDGYLAILEKYGAERPEILGEDERMLEAQLMLALIDRYPCGVRSVN